ncbi:MAG: T9SS type A sorting domain-containing protein [Microscillaceae bacterium]|nr:T9SS type A sorting domain-containing protein [Microscillaceae bacterium]
MYIFVDGIPQRTSINSPFFLASTGVFNPNIYHLQTQDVKDFLPEDGWELLTRDFGISATGAGAVTNPSFALYNRYTATIRFFFLLTQSSSPPHEGAIVSLSFDKSVQVNESALFASAFPVMPALINFEKGLQLNYPNQYQNEAYYWLFAEFPVAYDPCTCLFESNIIFSVSTFANINSQLFSINRGDRIIRTPGSKVGGTSGIPTYDNVLGIFTLIEVPKIEYVDYKRATNSPTAFYCVENTSYDPNCFNTAEDPYYECWNNNPETCNNFMWDNDIRQYKLVSDLKYAINPAANMDLIDLKVALVVEDTLLGDNPLANRPAVFGLVAPYSTRDERYHKMGYEFETDTRFRTAFVPVGCSKNTSIAVGVTATQGRGKVYPVDVYVKVQATFRRKDADENTQDVFYIGTYKTEISRSSLASNNLTFSKINTNRQGPDGYSLAPHEYPNTYYYQTNNEVFPRPIPDVAGLENPVYPANCSTVLSPMTAQALFTFCNDVSKYNPQFLLRNDLGLKEKAAEIPEVLLQNYPNPFNDFTNIKYTIRQSGNISLAVHDNLGNVVLQLLKDVHHKPGNYEIRLDNHGLRSGIYYCTMITQQGREVIKLIVH